MTQAHVFETILCFAYFLFTVNCETGGSTAITYESTSKNCESGERCDLQCNKAILSDSATYTSVWERPDTAKPVKILDILHDNASLPVVNIDSHAYRNRTEVYDENSLRFMSAEFKDSGRYRCTVKLGSKGVFEREVNLTVTKLPSDMQPKIEPGTLKMQENTVENVTCSFSGAYPAAHLAWMKLSGDAKIEQEDEIVTQNADQTYNTKRTARVTWGQRSSELSCKVTHPGLPGVIQSKIGKEPEGGWILPVVIIVILLIAAAIIAILLILYRKRTQGHADYKLGVATPGGEEGRELKDMSKKGGLAGFHEAAKSGNAEEVSRILDKNATVLNQQDEEGWTALHWASAYGHSDVVKALLKKQAAITTKNKAGDTAEELATSHKHSDIVSILQEAQAAERERLVAEA